MGAAPEAEVAAVAATATARAVSGARGSRCGGSGPALPVPAGRVSVLGEGSGRWELGVPRGVPQCPFTRVLGPWESPCGYPLKGAGLLGSVSPGEGLGSAGSVPFPVPGEEHGWG